MKPGQPGAALAGRLGALLLVFLLPACASTGAHAADERIAAPGSSIQGEGSAAESSASDRVDPVLARATLDSAWSRIANSYYDTTFRGVDWPAVHAELAPVADTTTTMRGLRALLLGMLGRLGESHLTIIPGEAVPDPSATRRAPGTADGWAGIALRLVDDQLVVTEVERESPAQRAGIREGWVLIRTGQDTAASLLALARTTPDSSTARRDAEMRVVALMQFRLRDGEPGDTVRAVFADDRNAEVERSIVLAEPTGDFVQFGNLPPMRVRTEHERMRIPGGCATYVYMSVWMPVAMPAVENAIDADSTCGGLVLDLRGNPGGVAGLAMRLGGLLLDEPIHLGVMTNREATLRFAVNPRRVRAGGEPASPYSGSVAILVDEFSMSTSEIVAAALQEVGRARVFGVQTTGQALPSAMVRLPSGDVLLHAVANYHTPGGRRVEGTGVVPDEVTPVVRSQLLAGRDAALEAALAWIASESPVP